MAASQSTHIGRGGGPRAPRKRQAKAGARAPVTFKPVKSIGRKEKAA